MRINRFQGFLSAAWLLALLAWAGCGTPAPEYPGLERAVRVVRHLSAKQQLQRSSFLIVYPGGRPSEFVSWMFSPLGKAEWPPADDSPELSPDLRSGMAATRTPVWPAGVTLVAGQPDPESGRQLVVRVDDALGTVKVQGYLDPLSPPVLEQEWPFPKWSRNISGG